MKMPRDVLETTTAELLGGDITTFDLDRLYHLITLTQHATDILLNEIERRGKLAFHEDMPIILYISDYAVGTILTRRSDLDWSGLPFSVSDAIHRSTSRREAPVGVRLSRIASRVGLSRDRRTASSFRASKTSAMAMVAARSRFRRS